MKGKNNGKLRRIRAQNARVMENPPNGINKYKKNILFGGRQITMSGRIYRGKVVPSKRLTMLYGHLVETLRDKDGIATGEVKNHMRQTLQLARA